MKANSTTYWLLFRGLRHYTGLRLNQHYRYQKALWKMNPQNRCWECSICNGKIKSRKEQTIDHIIPASVCWEVEMPELLVDPRNFRAAHKKCNIERGDLTLEDMPENIKNALKNVVDKRAKAGAL